jgi:cytochrome d ubiquinol oxidase subunit I
MNEIDMSLVDWSRAQFALTAMYHWLFVPLTLGMSFIMAISESIYVRTGNEEWKKLTKFWMKLFGINFVIGAATGIILEFEFGTNWSNYSWIVGDIFGAPLAVEGIFAFFLESTFIVVMFFGWNKVSKGFHLLSTWLVAVGSNLSALWILVANGWMNYPVGMEFNPDTARSEMVSFWDLVFSPYSVNKFLHTVSSSYVVGALFVIGVSSWFILKKRHLLMAKRSIVVASVFGLISALFVALTGDGSAYQVAQKQPAKLAAIEGLYEGQEGAGLVLFGILKDSRNFNAESNYHFKVEVPKLLSLLGYRDANAYVPGMRDLIYGNKSRGIEGVQEKMGKGQIAVASLAEYKAAKKRGDKAAEEAALVTFREFYNYIGYGYIEDPESIIPPIPLTFYSFHIMVALGFYFILLFAVLLYFLIKKKLESKKWLLRLALFTIPLGYLASHLGWAVAEVGRQPWAIQDILPVHKATSNIDTSSVIITFILFSVLFTALLIAEIRIMTRAIKNGPKE